MNDQMDMSETTKLYTVTYTSKQNLTFPPQKHITRGGNYQSNLLTC
jgi:hypothetical protein